MSLQPRIQDSTHMAVWEGKENLFQKSAPQPASSSSRKEEARVQVSPDYPQLYLTCYTVCRKWYTEVFKMFSALY